MTDLILRFVVMFKITSFELCSVTLLLFCQYSKRFIVLVLQLRICVTLCRASTAVVNYYCPVIWFSRRPSNFDLDLFKRELVDTICKCNVSASLFVSALMSASNIIYAIRLSRHFWDCKALLFTKSDPVSSAIARFQTFTFLELPVANGTS